MSKLVLGLILSAVSVVGMPAARAAKSAHKDQAASADKADTSETAAPLDKEAQQKLKEHLRMRDHIVKSVKYPATKESLVTTFKGLRDVKPGDRKWFEETLPSKTYQTPDEVMKALGWEVAPAGGTTTAKNGK
jgi:hypothetical protein